MSVSLKQSTRRTNIDHNNREMSEYEQERNEHIDTSKSNENIYIVKKDLKELYAEEFGESLEKYNAKQKRKDRKIDNYFEHIQQSKKTSLQQEIIVQVGDKDDFLNLENREKANEILLEFVKGFEERNPQLKIYNAAIHNDEASPHLHLNFVPVAEGYKRGLEKQVSFDKAILQQDSTLDKIRPFMDWREKEVDLLEKLLNERGIERKIVGTNEYKDVNEYKQRHDLKKEIKSLGLEKQTLFNEIRTYKEPEKILEKIQEKAEFKTGRISGKKTVIREKNDDDKLVILAKSEVKTKSNLDKANFKIERLEKSYLVLDQQHSKLESDYEILERECKILEKSLKKSERDVLVYKSKIEDTEPNFEMSENEKKGRLILHNLKKGHEPKNELEGSQWLSILEKNEKDRTIPKSRLNDVLDRLKSFVSKFLKRDNEFSLEGLKRKSEEIKRESKPKKSKSWDMER